ncbi:MAG: hypothetical protein K2X46_09110, partial [Roseomonas sp.]|nr:hypothetical protein [Roseomonas sp.]
TFSVVLSAPVGAEFADSVGICTIPGNGGLPMKPVIISGEGDFYDRFDWTYRTLKDTGYGFWGPPAGPKAFQVPYHSVETLIVEAPDYGHESVSETASFWAKLEAWKLGLTGVTAGYTAAWNSIETHFIPSATNQPVGVYNAAHPADYMPEGDTPTAYPVLGDPAAPVGADPLAGPLASTYGNSRMYLMHWFYDVDGVFGFRNGDGSTEVVAINNYQRGQQESNWESVTHCSWEDWTQGGGPYGFLPIFQKGLPIYPEAPFAYAKQWRYTAAPDAEVRVVSASFMASKFAAERGLNVSTLDAKAKKMGDYLRYALYDKYFRGIPGYDGTGKHNLVSWYIAWGGEIPTPPASAAWGFRIGSSEAHHGYNSVDAAYMMATAGEGYSPSTAGAAAQWQDSLRRQLEMIRWLQSPEGPIAGGVSNSWKGRYLTPTDGRQTAKFYGMYYTYAPVWHDPPSNNWVGFQGWGMERVAALYLLVAEKTGTFNTDVRQNAGVILDRWVPWVLDEATLEGDDDFTLPTNLSWVSATPVSGQTTTAPNGEAVYEFLPSLNWDNTGDYGAFWDVSEVPNPNLHCTITDRGVDLGTAAVIAQTLIQYVEATRRRGISLGDSIPNTSHTYQDAFLLAKALLDRIWAKYRDVRGFTRTETRPDYSRFNDPIYLPPGFSGTMPNGDVLGPSTTFLSMRSFMADDPAYFQIAAYVADPGGATVPSFRYNRFWHTAEVACAFAMMHRYFAAEVVGGA